jgi:hypothetical protein
VSLYLTGTFSGKDKAIQAIKQLTASGYVPADLTVFSDEPIEFPRGVLDRPSRMSLAVVTGAVVFFLLVVWFVYYTQYDYPLVTGGMPIFSFWPTGVVFYEITMAGATLTTLSWFIWESGLLRRDKSIPVPAIEPETICLRVRCAAAEQFETVAALLEKAGAKSVAKLEKAA